MKQSISHISTGFPNFDALIGGLERARLIIIGSRAGMGKSAFAISLAKNVAVEQHVPTAFFTLDMPTELMKRRFACCIGKVDQRKLAGDKLTEEKSNQYADAHNKLRECPLFIDDTPGLSIAEFESKVTQLVTEHHVRVVVVDYLQMMITGTKADNRKNEYSVITKILRRIADDLNLTIIICAMMQQKMRFSWNRPCLVHLRAYAGNIDKYADVVAFIHRPDFYCLVSPENREKRVMRLAEIIIKRNNLGNIGKFYLTFNTNASCMYEFQGIEFYE